MKEIWTERKEGIAGEINVALNYIKMLITHFIALKYDITNHMIVLKDMPYFIIKLQM